MAAYEGEPLKRELGDDTLALLSQNVQSKTVNALEELVANSWDADATKVVITYDPARGTYAQFDNGHGMSPDDLRNFYRVGSSIKREGTSPGGRRFIGKFGVGTLNLESLTKAYTLQTQDGQVKSTVPEVFEGLLDKDKEIIPTHEEHISEVRGTRIEMEQVHFREGPSFSIRRLKSALRWDFMYTFSDMEVIVNGEKLDAPSVQGLLFDYYDTGRKMGEVSGKIYYTEKPSQNAGIHIYVNKRRVGNGEELLNYVNSALSMQKHIVAFLDAPGLEQAIQVNRERFVDDHPAVEELRRSLKQRMQPIRSYVEKHIVPRRKTGFSGNLERMCEAVRRDIVKIPGIKRNLRVTMGDIDGDDKGAPFSSSEPGYYDSDLRILELNPEYAPLRITPTTKPKELQMNMLHAAVDAIALSNNASLSSFIDAREDMWGHIIPEIRRDLQQMDPIPVFGTRLYTKSELANEVGLSKGGLNQLIHAELLPSTEFIAGTYWNDIEHQVRDHVTLYDIAVMADEPNPTAVIDRYMRLIENAGEAAEPFVRRVGLNGKSCVLIHSGNAQYFSKAFSIPITKANRADYNPAVVFQMISDELLTREEVGRRYNLGEANLRRLTHFGRENDIEIRTERDGKDILYNIRDVNLVLQRMISEKAL
ncbi:ATP-binding protein [Candidatus Woesearchaeota archaeon]|nr:ATP-binding protein [Candidatus Woesearchaeota archaeon]